VRYAWSRVRILHVSTRLILGGSQENTVLCCEEQSRRGHEVHLAFGPIYGPEGSLLDRVRAFRTADGRAITTHVVPDLVREVRPWRDWLARRQLRRLIRDLRPGVVHTHSSKAGILGRLAAWDVSGGDPACRIIHTIHGPPFMPVEGGASSRLRTRVVNAGYALAERHAARRCHAIVSVADAMTREFLARGIGRPGLFTTVRSGMEVDLYVSAAPGQTRAQVRAALGLSESDFVVGTVARLAQHKGHDDLLEALAGDLRDHPRWKLVWVGDGWWRERLIGRARSLGLRVVEADRKAAPAASGQPPQLFVTGLVPPERIPGLIRSMDVLAHPSSREGLPRTVPQALLCGVCPVAYDIDGTGEVCREMQTGRLVRASDVPGLRSAITWCAAHPQERRDLALRGREECRGAFSVEAMVDGLDRVYAGAPPGPAR
jgi:glycosyltransferase involved in cell wall biosynthesis